MTGTDTIKTQFAPWQNIPMWTLCNQEKQPVKPDGSLLQWKQNPGDNINTLDTIIGRMKSGFGFGLIVGLHNSLVCYDFDNALDEKGNIINPKVREFIELVGSFTEISSGGKGLHLFVIAELPDGVTLQEYGFKKSFCDGKCYPSRFIKNTGICLAEYDLPVKTLTKGELDTIERKIGNTQIPPSFKKVKAPSETTVSYNASWDEILSEVGILHTRSQYHGKPRTYPDGTTRIALESYRIPCPNRHNHTGAEKRKKQFGPDAAILTRWDDGTSSVTCNHNACDPGNHPNLLQMLWNEIKPARSIEDTSKKQETAPCDKASLNLDNPKLVVNLPNNFVQKYIEYIHGMSDSYLEYQHGAALMLLSTAVNKRAYLPLTIGTIYPNLWVFCLGQSTSLTKNNSMHKTNRIYRVTKSVDASVISGQPGGIG